MKRLSFFLVLFVLILTGMNTKAQLSLFTSPPLTGGNGSQGVSFSVRALVSVFIDTIYVPHYGTVGTATNNTLWYTSTELTGAPTFAGPNWINIVPSNPTTITNSGTTVSPFTYSAIPIPGGLLMTAGTLYRFGVGIVPGSTGNTVYQTWSAANVDTFTNGFVTIYTGVGIGFGGTMPNPTIATRQFVGGLAYRPAQGRDLRLAALVTPTSLSVGSNAVSVSVQNAAADPITVADLGYQLDNNAPVIQTGVSLGLLNSGQTFTHLFPTPINIPANGAYTLRTWAVNANGLGADNNTSNDTLIRNLCTGLNGTYTIGATGNYSTLQAAINDLNNCGTTGSVIFQIQPGTYIGTYTINNHIGLSPNSISFTSSTSSAADVILIHDTASTATSRSVFTINGVQQVSFSNLTFRRTTTPAVIGHMIRYNNEANFGSITNCVFDDQSPLTSSTTFNNGLYADNADNLTIIGNTFNGFYYSIYLTGPTTNSAYEWNTSVVANTFTNYRYGVYVLNQGSIQITNNVANGVNPNTTFGYGIYLSRATGFNVKDNVVSGLLGNGGIFIANANDSVGLENLVVNNSITGPTFSTTSAFTAFYGIYVGASFSTSTTPPLNPRDKVTLYHNTVNMGINGVTGNTTNMAGIFLTGGSNTTPAWNEAILRNNMVVMYQPSGGNSFANLRGLYSSHDSLSAIINSNYNNFYLYSESTGAILTNALFRNNTTDYATISDWTTAWGEDANSISASPAFSSATLALPTAQSVNNLGTPLVIVPADITGATRNTTTPDMGAYEFTPSPFDLGVTGILTNTLCTDSNQTVQVTLKNVGLQTYNFATANVTLNLTITGPIAQSYSITINTDSLQIDSSRTFTLSSAVNFSIGGTYTLVADLTSLSDGNALNNTNTRTLSFAIAQAIPFSQDFTGLTAVPSGWTTNMALNTTAGFNQTPGLRFNVFSTNVANVALPLLGPIPGPGYLLEFAYKVTVWSGWTWPGTPIGLGAGDTIRLEVSSDCGLTYQTVSTITNQNFTPSSQYNFFRLPLTNYVGQRIYVRMSFRQTSGIDVFFDLDNFRIFLPPPVDLAVNRIIKPNSGCGVTSDTVRVEVINFGTAAQSNVPMLYRINGGTPVTEVFAGPINPGDTTTFTFATLASMPTAGAYSFVAYHGQANDADFSNDTSRKTINNIPVISTFPYVQGWENGNGGWVAGGANSSWALGTPTTAGGVAAAYNGSNAWVTNLTGQYNASERSFIESPCFDLSTLSNVRVRLGVFWETEGSYDGLNLQYSLDGGQTWIVAGTVGSGLNWYVRATTISNPNQPQWANVGGAGTGSGGWLPAEITLPQLANQANVRFRFYFSSDPSVQYTGVGVDSFIVDLPTDPIIDTFTVLTDSCINASRTVSAEIIQFRGLTSVNVNYDITGTGTFVAAPMTRVGTTNRWTGTIPVSSPSVRNRYFVSVVDSLGLTDTSATRTYVDNYLSVDVFPGSRTVAIGDTVILRATARGIANVKITEVVQFRTGTGATPTYPAYATGADLMEITNLGTGPADISGFSLEIFGVGARTYSFPSGVVIPGNGILILHLGSGVDDPANLYYNTGGGSDAISSISQSGYELKDAVGNHVDAVATNGFTFPAGTVSTANWSGTLGSMTSGCFRTISDNNNASDWTVANATNTMTIGSANPGMSIVTPVGGVVWNTTPPTSGDSLVVGPFTSPGTFTYIATLSDGRCTKMDTATITVGSLNPDVGVSRIMNPVVGSNHNGSSPVQVTVMVKNYGPVPAAGFDVEYRVNGGIAIVTNSITQNIQPGDSLQHTFTVAWTPTTAGQMTICANTTGMPNEQVRSNDTACVLVNSTVSLEELTLNNRLIGNVYPNPATTEVNFEFNEFTGNGALEVLDQLGRVVAQVELNRTDNVSYTLRTDDWAAGMYTYRLTTLTQLQTGKLVIRK